MLVCFTKFVFPSLGLLPDFKQPMSATAVQDKHCLKAESQQITIAGLLKCRARIHRIPRTYRLIHFSLVMYPLRDQKMKEWMLDSKDEQ